MAGSGSSTAVLARVAAISLVMLSALATEVPRGAAPSYIVTDLGTFGTVQSAQAFELNEAGQVVGRAARPRLPLAERREDGSRHAWRARPP